MPPPDPRHRPPHKEPTWGSILVNYALMAAVLLTLWAASQPLGGAVALAAVVALFVGARRARELARCLRDCRGFAFDLGGRVRVTVTPTPVDDTC